MKQSKGEETPAIYVADLADYNAGILRGQWIEIEVDTEIDDIQGEIATMLAIKGHEEYAVHDYNNLPHGGLGEYPDLEVVIEIARAVREHSYKLIDGYLSLFGVEGLPNLEDRFLGVYASVEDYAYEYMDSCYNLDKMMGNLATYFDYKAFARDLELGGDISTVELGFEEIAIFTSC